MVRKPHRPAAANEPHLAARRSVLVRVWFVLVRSGAKLTTSSPATQHPLAYAAASLQVANKAHAASRGATLLHLREGEASAVYSSERLPRRRLAEAGDDDVGGQADSSQGER